MCIYMSKQEKTATNNQWSSSVAPQFESCSGNCGSSSCHCKNKAEKSATNNQWTSTNS